LVSHIKGRIKAEPFKTSVLMKTFGPGKEEALRDRRNFHTEELHNLHFSSKITRVTSSKILVGHTARMQKRNTYVVLVGKKINKRGNLEDPGADWGIILKYILKTKAGRT
jgi:hypothetical protein